MRGKAWWGLLALLMAALLWLVPTTCWAQSMGLPSINIGVGSTNNPQQISQGLQLLILLTVLTLAPAILIMGTAFTRIVIVLSLTRQAIGTPTLPPNQVLVGLALILTFFVMQPTLETINTQALQPYLKEQITQTVALDKAIQPIRKFMFKQVRQEDLGLFVKLSKIKRPRNTGDVPTHVLLPAFIISELKTAFQLGFVVFLPFIIIDIVVSSILVSMGMMFLPPATIALPFKLVLFVMVDGWRLVCESLVAGFVQ
ncbi:MAG: flagellar type III secretion system pore protein FliP [Vampirovibrionales bacterium]|nr:flagellar type III secretion system pore protein FliP [Vampirovibrionales bacterium]